MLERIDVAPRTTAASFAKVDRTWWQANDTIQASAFNQLFDPVLVDVHDVRERPAKLQGTSQGLTELGPRLDIPPTQVTKPTSSGV